MQVSYHGVNAHAAGAPWEGVNGTNHPSLRDHCPSPFTQSLWLAVCFAALDAVLQAFSNISMMRQQMKPTWRVRHTTTPGTLPPLGRRRPDALTPEPRAVFLGAGPWRVRVISFLNRALAAFSNRVLAVPGAAEPVGLLACAELRTAV